MKENTEVLRLLEEKEKFLNQHPELRHFQKEIDRELAKTTDPQERVVCAFKMLMDQLKNELIPATAEFKKMLDEKIDMQESA